MDKVTVGTLVSISLLASSLARADQAEVDTTQSAAVASPPVAGRRVGDWGVGVGVGYSLLPMETSQSSSLISLLPGVAGGLGGAGFVAAGILNDLPALSVGAERQIGSGLWLMGGLGGATASYTGSAAQGSTASSTSLSYVGAAVGIRKVFNRDAPVEVSAFGTVGGGYVNLTSSSGASTSTQDFSVSAGAKGGLAFDYALTDHLSLRLVTSLLQVGYNTVGSTSTPAASTQPTSAPSGLSAGLTLQPTLELNMTF